MLKLNQLLEASEALKETTFQNIKGGKPYTFKSDNVINFISHYENITEDKTETTVSGETLTHYFVLKYGYNKTPEGTLHTQYAKTVTGQKNVTNLNQLLTFWK